MNTNKPKLTTPEPVQQSASAPLRKSFAGGVEPDSLTGRRLFYSAAPPPSDPDADLLAEVEAMSGSEMRRFLKTGTNRQDYDRALANKGRTK